MSLHHEGTGESPMGQDVRLKVAGHQWRATSPQEDIKASLRLLLYGWLVELSEDQNDNSQDPESEESTIGAARIRRLIAVNPNTPPQVLDELSQNDEDVDLLERIAENSRTSAQTLVRLSLHGDPCVRAAVAENAHTPLATLEILAKDNCPDVRYRIAENHNGPEAILEALCDDDNPYVAARAQKTLNRLRNSSTVAILPQRSRQQRGLLRLERPRR